MLLCHLASLHLAWVLSRVQLFVTPGTIAYQASLSMGFPRKEYWSGLPFASPGHLPEPGIKPTFLAFLALAGRFFITGTLGALYHQCLNNVQRMIGPENSLRMTEEWKIMTSQLFPGEQLRYTSNSQVVLQSTKFKQRIQDNTKMLIQIAWWDQWCLNLIPHPHLPEV